MVVKVDADGNTVWTRALPFAEDAQAEAVTTSRSGGMIVAGWIRTRGAAKSLFAVSLNADGAILWQRTVPQGEDVYGVRIVHARFGDYILGGSFGLIRLDSKGDVCWQRTLGDVAAFVETSHGHVVTVSIDSENASADLMLSVFNEQGGTVRHRRLADTCVVPGLWMSAGDEIVVVERLCSESRAYWVSTLSESGSRRSSYRLGIPAEAVPLEVKLDVSGGIQAGGLFDQAGSNAVKGWFFRSGRGSTSK